MKSIKVHESTIVEMSWCAIDHVYALVLQYVQSLNVSQSGIVSTLHTTSILGMI